MTNATLMAGAFGGVVQRTGPRRIETDYPHGFITVLMLAPVLLFAAGSVFSIIGAVVQGHAPLLISAVMGIAAAAGMGWLARYRWRSMGAFTLDVDADQFVRRRGGEAVDTYAIADIERVGRRWDPFHRGWGFQHWLIVHTRDGRSYRLGKSNAADVDAVLALLREWGVPG